MSEVDMVDVEIPYRRLEVLVALSKARIQADLQRQSRGEELEYDVAKADRDIEFAETLLEEVDDAE